MTDAATPTFCSEAVNQLLATHYELSGDLKVLPGEFDQNLLLAHGADRYIVKLSGGANAAGILMQNAAMTHLVGRDYLVPDVIPNVDGESLTSFNDDGRQYWLRVLTYLPGQLFASLPLPARAPEFLRGLGRFLGRIDTGLLSFDYERPGVLHKWDLAHGYMKCQLELNFLPKEQATLVSHFLEHYRAYVLPVVPELPRSFIHNDANDYNVLVDDSQQPASIAGLIDFGDMVFSQTVNEIAIAAAYALVEQPCLEAALCELVAGYHETRPLSEDELEVLFTLVALRVCTTICNAAAEFAQRPENEYLQVSVRSALRLLRKLRKLSPFAVERQLRIACGFPADTGKSKSNIIGIRYRNLGKTLSLSFREPLKIVAGQGVHLFDERGNDYLDMVNNVCHVGHCHPRVVAAGRDQMGRLNTNTRFLHDNIVNYAERLLATMPDRLSVCMFVNSGSEANELAFRLARTFSRSKDLLVVEGAYHGNTGACIDASPYKFDGPGGSGAPDHVHKVALPSPYGGKFTGMGRDTALEYARDVERVVAELAAKGRSPGAYICESLHGVAGQIIMPEGYLGSVYPMIRQAGGVCIADEVQVGFGRVGTDMWAFETQGVVPDIVTLGKPIGNGHPLAAVVTTQEIADAFVTGMEYFNTFGGNPVSCAIGMAVLDVIQDEGLQNNALEVGQYLMDELRDMQCDFAAIGDVRGLGLFIGVELVLSRQTRRPATALASRLIEFVKQQRVILSTEGPFHNVLKIKPPIVFGRGDADRFLSVLRRAFEAVESHRTSATD